MGRRRVERLWDLVLAGVMLRVICANPNCGRAAVFDPQGLRDFLRASPMIDQIGFTCGKCGSKKFYWEGVPRPARAPRLPKPEPITAEVRVRPARPDVEPPRLHTLAEWREETSWVWWFCENFGSDQRPCGYCGGLALVPYILYFGPDADADVLRKGLQCPRCLGIGAAIRLPSQRGSHGPQDPPAFFVDPLIVARDDGGHMFIAS